MATTGEFQINPCMTGHDYRFAPEGSTATHDMVVCSKCGSVLRHAKIIGTVLPLTPSYPFPFDGTGGTAAPRWLGPVTVWYETENDLSNKTICAVEAR